MAQRCARIRRGAARGSASPALRLRPRAQLDLQLNALASHDLRDELVHAGPAVVDSNLMAAGRERQRQRRAPAPYPVDLHGGREGLALERRDELEVGDAL